MTLLVAILIASSLVHDGVRDYLIQTIHHLEPKTTSREGRNKRYRPFTLRRLPALTFSLTPTSTSTDDQTAVQRTVQTLRHSWMWLVNVTGTQRYLDPITQHALRTLGYLQPYLPPLTSSRFPTLDTLPFPAPSLLRRIVAWSVDSCLIYFLTLSLKGTGLRQTVSALAWVTRDLWLCGWGHQSPGRWLVGQVVVSTEIAHHLNRECAGTDGTPPAHPFVMAPVWHDKEVVALITFNALRVFLHALGPVAMLTWLCTALPPALHGNGRTGWDRWTHMQVIDTEVLQAWSETGKFINHPNAKPLWESEVVENVAESERVAE